MSGRHHGATRVGRLPRWQRWLCYGLLGTCAATGLLWFVLLDALGMSPPQLRLWWVGHGVSGLAALLAIGSVLAHHVTATWRNHRNRWLGGLTLGSLAAGVCSAFVLMYGPEELHTCGHWAHVGLGMFALLVVPAHVVYGRRSRGAKTLGARGGT
ncbi:hypothetical protein [Variovorax ginsengisoli]|uniref:hypothetical protein n=1 Tax=Variovorax ginsengisoli TaxID=363844 RepID=UPI0027D8B4A7|nr:hypothetical protein [Variovorax ginsengisoli]